LAITAILEGNRSPPYYASKANDESADGNYNYCLRPRGRL
jgi:hypothetical protein